MYRPVAPPILAVSHPARPTCRLLRCSATTARAMAWALAAKVAVMQRAEQAARGIGRTLLTLDTRAGDAGEALYRALGWQQAGRIPGYASDASGALHDTLLFYKGM